MVSGVTDAEHEIVAEIMENSDGGQSNHQCSALMPL